MSPDHLENKSRARLHSQLQRRFRESDQIFCCIDIEVDTQGSIEPWCPRRPVLIGSVPTRGVTCGNLVRVIQQRDFLLGVVGKPKYRTPRPQPVRGGESHQCRDSIAFAILVRRFDDHHRVGFDCSKDDAQGLSLLRAGHIATTGPLSIVEKLVLFIKQVGKPFDIMGGDPHQRLLPDQVSQARLISIMRFWAIATASCGNPRATNTSG